MVRLYIETNFLMSHASGRDLNATRIVQNCPVDVQRNLPASCIMEAFSSLESQRRQYRGRNDGYQREAREAARSLESPKSLELARTLETVRSRLHCV